MKKYSFDTYCDSIKLDAISEIIKNKRDIIEPISWIKLQQGCQGGIAVTHITLNYGGKDRKGLNEQSFEIYAKNLFPTDIEELIDSKEDDSDSYSKLISLSNLDKEKKEELIEEWELPDDILCGELWKCGHDIKVELIKAGFKVTDDCIVCYGDEDNTWGWKADGYEEKDVVEYLNAKDLKDHSYDLLEKLAILFYDKNENREWFLSKVK
ncbi:hypothetical protein Q4Q39_04525 [Flavivirga amylovorans]|uniref:Uncharacterized protein n=1 Tax=Flavivirga amylovorans TaxID=870486 RepID=A0ABT8WY96_9FLAO|nr:hypothetical protein [Flavivirga amylovorans]MDO5986666.1 hypothetical protein [Flavivirga amylovorans]